MKETIMWFSIYMKYQALALVPVYDVGFGRVFFNGQCNETMSDSDAPVFLELHRNYVLGNIRATHWSADLSSACLPFSSSCF